MDGTPFDIFLSHNSRDKPAVERIAVQLRQAGFSPWLDAWDLPAGGDWQDGIELGLRLSRGCAVFLGPHGFGDWQAQEMKVASSMAAHDPAFRYFLTLLPGAPDPLDAAMLPAFINLRGRINLREGFASPRQLQPLVNAILGVAMGSPGPGEADLGESPYRGLEAFDAEHAEYFFGRDAEIRKVLDRLRDAPFLAVIGPSGSGKSSLVLAGVLPALRGGRLAGSADWPVVIMVPGARPVEALAVALDPLDPGRSRNRLLEELRGSPLALRLEVNALLRDRPREARLVLVVDQFEEIFTLCRDDEERDAFLGLLLEAAAPEGRAIVIITMRADFYPRITEYPALAEQVANHQLLVGALTNAGLSAAIEQPALRNGLQFEPGLVSTILADVGNDAGALPLLQYALDELWKRQHGGLLTLEGYRASGGVGEAIATRANTVFEQLSPGQQTVARRVLLRLTQPGEATEDTRRRAELDELVTRPADRPAIESAINALVAARLLTASRDEASGAAQVDVAHEALIRAWPRLRQWLDEDRQGLLVHRRLTEAASEWQRHERDADLLYRGSRLSEALAFAALQPDALNDTERAFLTESEGLREQERAAAADATAARERLRRRMLAGLGLFSAVALCLALLAGWQWREAGLQAAAAQAEAAAARRAETTSLARLLAVQSGNQAGAFDLGLLLAAEAYELDPDDFEVRRSLLAAVQEHPALERVLHGEDGRIDTVAFSPDGALLASGSNDGTIRLWDPATGQPVGAPLDTGQGQVTALKFRPTAGLAKGDRDNWQLASGSANGVIQFWDTGADAPRPLLQIEGQGQVGALAFSPDGARIAAAFQDGTIAIWNAETGDVVISAWPAHEGFVTALAFSPDESLLVSGGLDDGKVLLWDAARGNALGELVSGEERVHAVAFNPTGTILVTASGNQVVRWDAANRLPLGVALTGEDERVGALAVSGNGAVLAAADADGTIWRWDMASGDQLGAPLMTGQPFVLPLALNHDGSRMATGDQSADVRLWAASLPGRDLFVSLLGHTAYPHAIAISPDNATIATGDENGAIFLWDAADGALLHGPLRGHSGGVWTLEFNHDGSLLASASEDGTARVWKTGTGAVAAGPLGGHGRDELPALAFSPKGEWLATGGSDGSVRLWRVTADGVDVDRLVRPPGTGAVWALAFDPAGAVLAAATGDGDLLLWNLADEASGERRIVAGQSGVHALCFVADDEIATGGDDGTIRSWRVSDGQEARPEIAAHDGSIFKLSCNPGTARMVSTSFDGRVRLWEVGAAEPLGEQIVGPPETSTARMAVLSADGSHLALMRSNQDEHVYVAIQPADGDAYEFPIVGLIRDVTLSADGSRVAAGSETGMISVWDVATGEQLAAGQTEDEGGILSVAFNPGGDLIATGSGDGAVRLWDSASAEPIDHVMRPMPAGVDDVAFSGTGGLLAAGDLNGFLQIWDVAQKQVIGEPLRDDDDGLLQTEVLSVAVNADGSLVAAGELLLVKVWNTATREMTGETLLGHGDNVRALAFSPVAPLLASADGDGQIRFWDVSAHQPAGPPVSAGRDPARTLAFSKDGELLAVGGLSGSITVWDVASRAQLGQVDLRTPGILSIVFSDDRSELIALDARGTVGRWDLSPASWLEQACAVANRNLTLEEWQRFIGDPGDPARPYHETCPDLPGPTDVGLATPVAGPGGTSA